MRDVLFVVLLVAALLLVAAAGLGMRALLRGADAAEAGRRESEERLMLVANSVPALISYVDREQRYRYSNRTYEEWFGFSHERMLGSTMREVFGDQVFEDSMRGNVELVLLGERVEFEYSHGEGERARTLQVTYAPHFDLDGDVLGFYVLASDITALKQAQLQQERASAKLAEANKRLEFLAHHDTLTELPNRAMLQERVGAAISLARRHQKSIGVLFVDLDRFKHVNDSLGHSAGDELLQPVPRRLRDCVREEDLVARLGGDEFPRAPELRRAERRRRGRAEGAARRSPSRSSSPGTRSTCPPASASRLPGRRRRHRRRCSATRTSRCTAPRSGAAATSSSLAADDAALRAPATLERELRQALERGEFVLHYQPQRRRSPAARHRRRGAAALERTRARAGAAGANSSRSPRTPG